MKYENFKHRARSILFYNKQYKHDIWDEIKQIKNETANIDFGCKFNSKGLCNTAGTFWNRNLDQKCCCRCCAGRIGYLQFINSNKDLKYYARRFSYKTGFWREGKCCILNRNMRSTTCVTYTCWDMLKPKMNKIARKLDKLYKLTNMEVIKS